MVEVTVVDDEVFESRAIRLRRADGCLLLARSVINDAPRAERSRRRDGASTSALPARALRGGGRRTESRWERRARSCCSFSFVLTRLNCGKRAARAPPLA